MNEAKQEQLFYKLKQNIYTTNNKNINYPQQNKKKILQNIKAHLICPTTIIREKKTISFLKSFQSDLSNKNSILQSPIRNNKKYKIIQNLNNNNLIEEKKIIKNQKIKIKLNKNIKFTVNNDLLNYKIHKINPKNKKKEKISIISPNKLCNNTYLEKINNKLINSIKNSFELSEFNIKRKNNENSLSKHYNKFQEKNLETLNNNIENLIREKSASNKKYCKNNSLNKNNKKIINWKKVSFINKLKKKKNISETFSNPYFLNMEKFKENQIRNRNINSNINKKITKMRTFWNNLNQYKLSNLNNNNKISIKLDLNNLTINDDLNRLNRDNFKQNSSILFPSSLFNSQYIYKKKLKKKNDYIKIENNNSNSNNNNNNLLNNNDGDNNNYIKTENSVEKIGNRINNYSNKNNYFTIAKERKNLILNSPNYNGDKIANSTNPDFNKNILINSLKLNNKKDENNFNYYINNNWSSNINNNYHIEYINNSCNYKHSNTINNIDKIQKYSKEINTIRNTNLAINGKHYFTSYDYPFKPKIIINKKIIVNKKKRIANKSENKKLRNIITSIKYRNKKNNLDSGSDLDEKNIILSEVDNDGKINIKVKEMKNSIEKIIRENSANKKKNYYIYSTNPKESLTYVKKNQGTHFSKNKNYINNIHQIE